MQSPSIRLATHDDIEAIFHVHRRSVKNLCTKQYTDEQISFWLDGRAPNMYIPAIDKDSLWIAEGNCIVGFVEIDGSEISKLFVCSSHAFAGIGRKLLNVALNHITLSGAKKAYLESTITAVHFYEKHGFQIIESGTFSHGNGPISLEIVKMEYPLTQ